MCCFAIARVAQDHAVLVQRVQVAPRSTVTRHSTPAAHQGRVAERAKEEGAAAPTDRRAPAREYEPDAARGTRSAVHKKPARMVRYRTTDVDVYLRANTRGKVA